LKKKPEKNPEL